MYVKWGHYPGALSTTYIHVGDLFYEHPLPKKAPNL